MKFSIIMPSFLGEYRTAARNRDQKFVRAIKSCLNQSFQDFEVVIISDGCDKTVTLFQDNFPEENIRCFKIPKSKLWSGVPRQTGIEQAKGDYIVYLDTDDILGKDHLQNISNGLGTFDWVWFNDIRYSPHSEEWYQNPCDIMMIGKHGTSNICHKRSLPYKWDHSGYAHDYYFIKHLKQNINYTKIEGGQYYVCHIPNSNEGKGYDL